MLAIEPVRDPTWSEEKVAELGSTHFILHKCNLTSQNVDLANAKSYFRQVCDPHASSKKMREKYACIPKLASKAVHAQELPEEDARGGHQGLPVHGPAAGLAAGGGHQVRVLRRPEGRAQV